MSEINTVSLLNQIRAMTAQAGGASVEAAENQAPFSSVFKRALDDVNELHQNSDALKSRYEMGDKNVSVSEVMIASQKASLGFEATLRVRNKVVDAYQDIMNMPI